MFKKILVIITFVTMTVAAQAAQYVQTDGLTDVQRAELALQAAQMKASGGSTAVDGVLQNLSKVEGIGKETGIAIREGLEAVTDVAEKFGKTNVGQITIALIVWRVAGRDVVTLAIGSIALLVGIWFFRRMSTPHKIIDKYKDVPILFGLYVRRIPEEWHLDEPSDEWKASGVIGLGISVVIFVVALANM